MKYKGKISDDYDLVTKKYVETYVEEHSGVAATYHPFKDAWLSKSTTSAAASAMCDDSTVNVGDAYIGTVWWNDLPYPLSAAEATAIVGKNGYGKKYVFMQITSSDTYPYVWTFNSMNSDSNKWKAPFEAEDIYGDPLDDGTYILKCVVSDGRKSYQWVKQ